MTGNAQGPKGICGRRGGSIDLSAVDRLLAYLFVSQRTGGSIRQADNWMRDDGFNDTEIGRAWLESRKAGLTAMTGLGADRLPTLDSDEDC